MSAQLLADAVYRRAQAARDLERLEQQYRQFVMAAFPHRQTRKTRLMDRAQHDEALAGYRRTYEDRCHALREMDWVVEGLTDNAGDLERSDPARAA